jgi:hypothetical protein
MTPDIQVGIVQAGEAVVKALARVQATGGDQVAIDTANVMLRIALVHVLQHIGPRCALQMAEAALADLKREVAASGPPVRSETITPSAII